MSEAPWWDRHPTSASSVQPMPSPYRKPPTLTEFLLARIAEDEAAQPPPVDLPPPTWEVTYLSPEVHAPAWLDTWVSSNGWWSPERARTECEAKRLLIELTQEQRGMGPGVEYVVDRALELLALPYAGHPDYREEWKP